jgi:hypothetical protein
LNTSGNEKSEISADYSAKLLKAANIYDFAKKEPNAWSGFNNFTLMLSGLAREGWPVKINQLIISRLIVNRSKLIT